MSYRHCLLFESNLIRKYCLENKFRKWKNNLYIVFYCFQDILVLFEYWVLLLLFKVLTVALADPQLTAILLLLC